MKRIYKFGLVMTLILSQLPAQAADELITGVKNEYVLMGVLGTGILLLFISILTLAYMLHRMLPSVLRKRIEMENKSQ